MEGRVVRGQRGAEEGIGTRRRERSRQKELGRGGDQGRWLFTDKPGWVWCGCGEGAFLRRHSCITRKDDDGVAP